MKFSELNDHQQMIFKDIASNIMRSSLEQRNNLELFSIKMLLIANGSGLLAMASVIGGIIGSDRIKDSLSLRGIAVAYFIGLIFAAFAHRYTEILAINRVPHTNGTILGIIGDILKFEDAKDFNFDPKVRNRHVLCVLFAAIFFALGTILAIIIL